jgi:hypothetical protein
VAQRGRPIPGNTVRLILGLRALRYSLRSIARHTGVALSTVQKYLGPRAVVRYTRRSGVG